MLHNTLPIKGFPGYHIDREGNIYSTKQKKVRKRRPSLGKDGYKRIIMTDDRGKSVTTYVARLVAMAFCPGYKEGMTVNHKNLDKADNLEWVTFKENHAHWRRENPEALERQKQGIINKTGVSTKLEQTTTGETMVFRTNVEAARFLGVDPANLMHARERGRAFKGYRVSRVT